MEQARAAIDDPEPYFPGSFDDVVLAYDLGWLSDGTTKSSADGRRGEHRDRPRSTARALTVTMQFPHAPRAE
jgi:hypothetical protein